MSSSPSVPTASVRFTWPFRAVSRELGLDSSEVWTHFGFTQEMLADPDTRVPLDVSQQLIRWVIAATGIPDYGLRAAEAAEPGLFDLPEYAARCQPTLGGALERIISLIPLLSDAALITKETHGEMTIVRMLPDPDLELESATVEFSMAYWVMAGRRFAATPEGYSPALVKFRHPAPHDISHHERLFRAPMEFGADMNALLLPTHQLSLPMKFADSRLAALLDQAADHLVAKTSRQGTFAEGVRRLVTKHISSDGAPVTTIADELGITPRTLHRRLAEENVVFRDLADDVRKGLALAYMERRELAVSEIAYLLGFSGVQAFHRAFKRWTNETPGEFRKRR